MGRSVLVWAVWAGTQLGLEYVAERWPGSDCVRIGFGQSKKTAYSAPSRIVSWPGASDERKKRYEVEERESASGPRRFGGRKTTRFGNPTRQSGCAAVRT